MANLEITAGKLKPDLILVQEPLAYKGKFFKITNYTTHATPFSDTRPRACIYAHERLDTWMLPDFTERDACAVSVGKSAGVQSKQLIVASLYLPGEGILPPVALSNLVDFCSQHGRNLVIGTDANAHHMHWGSTDINQRGEDLLAYIMTTNLNVCNVGSISTFANGRREEVLDVTLATMSAEPLIRDWKVRVDVESLSDHRYITYEVNHHRTSKGPIWRRNVRNTDWARYQTEILNGLNQNTTQINNCTDVDDVADSLRNICTTAFHNSCPMKCYRGKTSAPWWNPELTQLRLTARRAQRKADRQKGNPEVQADYREALRNFKKAIKKAKTTSWKLYCQSIEDVRPASRAVKSLTLDKVAKLSSLKKDDGTFTKNAAETLDLTFNTFFPATPNPGIMTCDDHTHHGRGLAESICKPRKVVSAINTFKPFKSPGPDGIYPALLQHAIKVPEFISAISDLFIACLAFGYMPKGWQDSKVVFIPKPGRKDYHSVKSFRPICLSSFFLKSLERLILWRLEEVDLKDCPISQNQHAFCAGRSTDTALHTITEKLEKAVLGDQFALAVFLDIEGAFNNVSFSAFRNALDSHNINPTVARLIMHMIKNQQVNSTLMDASLRAKVHKGGPQGGVLMPLLWNLVINPLLITDLPNPLLKVGFADDVTGITSGCDLKTLHHQAQGFLDEASKWAENRGLKLSDTKTCAVIFTNKHAKNRVCAPLKLYGHVIPFCEQVRCLGIKLDHRLSWRPHCLEKTKRALTSLAQIRRAVGSTWGISPRIMRWIYCAIIRPGLSFGALTWINALDYSTVQEALKRVQGRACRAITGAYHTTPFEGLNAALSIPPLDLFIRGEAIKTYHRLNRSGMQIKKILAPPKGNKRSHNDIVITDARDIRLLDFPCDWMTPYLNLELKFTTAIPNRADVNTTPPQANHIHCYTDGSKHSGSTGYGYTIFKEEGEVATHYSNLGAHSSVYQAEVIAIQTCAMALMENSTSNSCITIHSDSQAAIHAFNKVRLTSKIVIDTIRTLNELGTHNQVVISWIPGHSGHSGNERADSLAKLGALARYPGPLPAIPIPLSSISMVINNWVSMSHATRWENLEESCRQTKQALPTINPKISNKLISLPRRKLRAALMAITGHGYLNRHRFIQGIVDSPTCPYCLLEPETPSHYLCFCPQFLRARTRNIGLVNDISNLFSLENISCVLAFINESGRLENHTTD